MKKGWIIGIAVAVVVVGFFFLRVLPGLIFASGIPEPGSVTLKKEEAIKLVNDFEAYGKIYELDECTRYSKSMGHLSG